MATVPLRHRVGFLAFLMESSGLFSEVIFFGVSALRILIIRGAISVFQLKYAAGGALDSGKTEIYCYRLSCVSCRRLRSSGVLELSIATLALSLFCL